MTDKTIFTFFRILSNLYHSWPKVSAETSTTKAVLLGLAQRLSLTFVDWTYYNIPHRYNVQIRIRFSAVDTAFGFGYDVCFSKYKCSACRTIINYMFGPMFHLWQWVKIVIKRLGYIVYSSYGAQLKLTHGLHLRDTRYCASLSFVYIRSSPPGQNGRQLADNIFRFILVNEKFRIMIKFSLRFVPKSPIDNWLR